MGSNPKVSVIVPIYNVEKYLRECLDSIQSQTYTDFECIMINDGSVDKSKEIAESYLNDKRFILVNQDNSGQSVARNKGIKMSRGEFLCFVDSDDIINIRLLEILLAYEKNDYDIIEADFTTNREKFDNENCENVSITFKGEGEEVLKACIDTWAITHQPVAKLYRKSLIESNLFPEGLIYEDLYTGIAVLKEIRRAIKINVIGYYYRPNPNGTMKGSNIEKQLDIFKICELLEEYYADKPNLKHYINTVIFHNIAQRYLEIKKYTNVYDDKFNQWLNKYSKNAYPNNHYLKTYKIYPEKFYYVKRLEQLCKLLATKLKKGILMWKK